MKNSLFRIDKNSVAAEGRETAGLVELPCLEEMMQRLETEDDPLRETDADVVLCEDGERTVETEKEIMERELSILEGKIEQARHTAEEILEAAEEKAVEIKGNALTAGYAAGLEQAKLENEEDCAQAKASLAGALHALESAADDLYAEMEKSVLDLSLYIAEHIIKTEITDNEDAYKNMVNTMLVGIKNQSNIALKVSKEEYERFFADQSGELGKVLKNSGIKVVQDISLKSGDCVAETEFGYMDAGILTQLKRLEYSLKQFGAAR